MKHDRQNFFNIIASLFPIQKGMDATANVTVRQKYIRNQDLVANAVHNDYMIDENDYDAYLWHNRFAHMNFDQLKLSGLPAPANRNKCIICGVAKHARRAFPAITELSTTEPLQLIHSDVCYPMDCDLKGYKYSISFIDDFSRFSHIALMTERPSKGKVFEILGVDGEHQKSSND